VVRLRSRRSSGTGVHVALVACVVVAGFLVAVLHSCSDGDELWARLRQDMAGADIVSAELRADGLKTTAVVVLLHYADGRALTPNQWPDGRFEVRYEERQFLVRCPELEALLKERGFVYK
jgi:hypothetical protein